MFSTVFDPAAAHLAGTHRIQRVPDTEKRGRRHSSEVTVVALDHTSSPAGFRLDPADVRVDIFRASGKGGQNRNKVETAVRLTHMPSGIVVTATEERHKGQNLKVAWQRLRDTLDAQHRHGAHQQLNAARAGQFEQARSFTWTAWRDEVKASDGRRTSMRAALRGKLGPLI